MNAFFIPLRTRFHFFSILKSVINISKIVLTFQIRRSLRERVYLHVVRFSRIWWFSPKDLLEVWIAIFRYQSHLLRNLLLPALLLPFLFIKRYGREFRLTFLESLHPFAIESSIWSEIAFILLSCSFLIINFNLPCSQLFGLLEERDFIDNPLKSRISRVFDSLQRRLYFFWVFLLSICERKNKKKACYFHSCSFSSYSRFILFSQ